MFIKRSFMNIPFSAYKQTHFLKVTSVEIVFHFLRICDILKTFSLPFQWQIGVRWISEGWSLSFMGAPRSHDDKISWMRKKRR